MSVTTMSLEERRKYNREHKRKERARKKEERAELDPSDKRFAEHLTNMSPEHKRDWLRVHPIFLRSQCKSETEDAIARGMGQDRLVTDLAAKYGYTIKEIVEEGVKASLAKDYGFSEDEVEKLLDPSYKPEPNAPLEFPEPPTVIIDGKPERVYDVETKERDSDGSLITKTLKMYWAAVNPQICAVSHVLLSVDDTKEQYEERIRRAKQRQSVVAVL